MWAIAISFRPSVSISHFNLLLRNHCANCNQTLVEWSLRYSLCCSHNPVLNSAFMTYFSVDLVLFQSKQMIVIKVIYSLVDVITGITRAPPTCAGRSTFSYLILNCKQFTKLYILLTSQQIGVNTFYKCSEFQVNSFDSYWEILIILKKYPKFLCTMYYVETRADNSGYANHRVICLVVIGSSFDIEQVFQVSNGYLW